MTKKTLLAAVVSAFVAGAAFVIACSDDSPGDADAATCDCPAAEPPLAGRIQSVTMSGSIPPGSENTVTVGCPTGATILGGGCRMPTTGGMTLEQSGIDRAGIGIFICTWRSTATEARTGTAEAICLMPAQ